MILVDRRLVIEAMLFGQPLPLWSRRRFHQRRHSLAEQIVALVHVHDVENHSLVLLAIVDREVEPEAVSRIAGVRSKTQVVLELTDKQDVPEVSRLESRVEAQISLLGLAAVASRANDQPINVAKSSLFVRVFAV